MKSLYKIGIIVLINIYIVIIAGSIVRMTGSGMGCPDWPKCFGYFIPPTSEDKLEWNEGREFEKGQIIIKEVVINEGESNERLKMHLLVSNKSFTSAETYNADNWDVYEKHDYAKFNVYHTWTEYMNRLSGALLGVFAFIMLVLSFKFWKKDKGLAILSMLQVFFIGFEAWLGKLTVDSHLSPVVITYHMLGVIVLIFIQVYFLIRLKRLIENKEPLKLNLSNIRLLVLLAIGLLVSQVIMGTQVRQQVDLFLDAGIARDIIADSFTTIFYVHRSFSIVLILIIGFIILKNWKSFDVKRLLGFLGGTLVLEILVGIFLSYFGMQAIGQPFHLFLSILMFGFLVKIFFEFSEENYLG